MDTTTEKIKKILELTGFKNPRVSADEEHRKISIVVDDEMNQTQTAATLGAMDHLFNLILHREEKPIFVFDLNYYRKERERIIIDLAKAAARKAVLIKSEVELPPMNAYERRLVHVEFTTHPALKTESVGLGRERRVVIKQLTTDNLQQTTNN